MTNRLKRIAAVFCFAAALSMVPGMSGAYILRGPHILELMTQKAGKPSSMLVSQAVWFFHEDGSQRTEAVETLRYLFSKAFRSDAVSENAERIYLMDMGRAMTVIDGRVAETAESMFDAYKDILLFRSRDALQQQLVKRGIDMAVVALGRFDEKIAFVIGAERPDEPVPQVWIDKETFLPLRWVMRTEDGSGGETVLDIRYADWRQIEHVWYPMQIAFYEGEKLVREIKVSTVKTNLTFPEELFDIKELKAKYAAAVPEAKDGSVSQELNDIEKSINEFRRKFE